MEMPCTRAGPERVDGDRRHQRRVDPARQADHGLGEAVLGQVVAGAEDERGVHLGVVAEGRAQRDRCERGAVGPAGLGHGDVAAAAR